LKSDTHGPHFSEHLTAFRAEKDALRAYKKLGITPKGTAGIYISSQL